MKLTQSWVGYLDRSYQQVKDSLIKRLVQLTPEITDHNESNLFIIIMDMFSGVAEMINYYIDIMGREGFLGTAQRFTSVLQLAKLIDYPVHASTSASVSMLFSLTQTGNVPYFPPGPLAIPKGTIITDNNGNIFQTLADAQFLTNQTSIYIPASQYEDITLDTLGETDGTENQALLLPVDYVDGSMIIFINGELWTLYESFGLMLASTKGFVVSVEEDGNAYVIFGDGTNGLIPDSGFTVQGTYRVSNGAAGNQQPNSISNLSSNIPLPATFDPTIKITVTNPDYSSGGAGIEDIEDIRNKAPRWIRTLGRAVTYQDYKDVAMLLPDVGNAEVSYCCGKFVSVYIVPLTQGVASNALVAKEQNWMNCKKMITTKVSVIAAGISKIFITANIYAKPLFAANDVLLEVIPLLQAKYGWGATDINGRISVSDIVAIVEGAKSVDHIDIVSVQVLPTATPVAPNTDILNIAFTQLPKTATKYVYTLIYNSSTFTFKVLRGGTPMGTIGIGSTYNDGIVGFKISSAAYANQDKWQFTAVPSFPEIFPQTVLDISDFSLPILDIGPLLDPTVPQTIYSDLEVITQGVNQNCLPPCN